MMKTSWLPTSPLWKQQRTNETSTILRWTALYLMLFRLVCTAIATLLRSETYHALHHRYNFHIASRYFASYTFPLSTSSNSALLLLYKQTVCGKIGLLLASKQSEYQVLSYNSEGMKLLPPKSNSSTQSHGLCHAQVSNNEVSNNGKIIVCHSLDVIRRLFVSPMKSHLSASTTNLVEWKIILHELKISFNLTSWQKHQINFTTINLVHNRIIIHHHEGRARHKITNLNHCNVTTAYHLPPWQYTSINTIYNNITPHHGMR